jgi:hypothetical protein
MSDGPLYPKLAETTERVACSDPETGNTHRAVRCTGGKRPWEPPVIETFYPRSTGLPPDVVDEWSGKCVLRAETDENSRRLRLIRSQGMGRWWWRIFGAAMAGLGLQHLESRRVD